MHLPVEFPPPDGTLHAPEWTGRGFRVEGRPVSVLSYDAGTSNWSDELTEVHEEAAGEDHYIDRASRRHTLSQLRKWIPQPSPVIMDIGCSSGYLLKLLKQELPGACLIGADYVRGPLENLARTVPEIPLVQFNLVTCPLAAASFDGLVLLNVLEHIEDDVTAAQQVFRLLKPGGVAVLEVPAGPHLYDIYDKKLMHFRRYRMSGFLKLLRGAGFEILESSHLGFFLYPGFYAVKKRNQRLLKSEPLVQDQAIRKNMQQSKSNAIFHGLMRAEARLRQIAYLPTGIRCLATCRRPAV